MIDFLQVYKYLMYCPILLTFSGALYALGQAKKTPYGPVTVYHVFQLASTEAGHWEKGHTHGFPKGRSDLRGFHS
jgi:hypothetical protein